MIVIFDLLRRHLQAKVISLIVAILILGFGILVLSQVPANARLGGLVVVSIAGCLVATLVVLPALLRILHKRLGGASRG